MLGYQLKIKPSFKPGACCDKFGIQHYFIIIIFPTHKTKYFIGSDFSAFQNQDLIILYSFSIAISPMTTSLTLFKLWILLLRYPWIASPVVDNFWHGDWGNVNALYLITSLWPNIIFPVHRYYTGPPQALWRATNK